jgi:hypothetical protein
MNDGYDLKYVSRISNKIYDVKRVVPGVYRIRDPLMPWITEQVSKYRLKKEFEFQGKVSMANVRERTQPMMIQKLA